ncbi:putative RNA methyltransferase [Cucurbita argyrosperma subsp. argyrosperma]|nr:putative RNA methyltransferase [Cucurbita argyrosperma subsp. argyrosperma]
MDNEQRAVPIRVLTVGKKRSRGVQLLIDEYIDKLNNYCNVEDVQLRSNPRNARDPRAQVDDEDIAVVNLLKSDDWVVMLDENGKEISSEQMAELVADAGNTGASRLAFCIGGPYGHGQQLRQRANVSIKLSSMVLNHQIALLVLMEQLYRGFLCHHHQTYLVSSCGVGRIPNLAVAHQLNIEGQLKTISAFQQWNPILVSSIVENTPYFFLSETCGPNCLKICSPSIFPTNLDHEFEIEARF